MLSRLFGAAEDAKAERPAASAPQRCARLLTDEELDRVAGGGSKPGGTGEGISGGV
jgi:hypothetical protein